MFSSLGSYSVRSPEDTGKSSCKPLRTAYEVRVTTQASLLAEALLAVGERLKAHEIAKLALARDGTNRKAREVFEATVEEYSAWSSQ